MPKSDRQMPLDPFTHAMQSRDRDTPTMVREALAAGRTQLAYQRVVSARDPTFTAFHEGFVRVLDEGGRLLPASAFLPEVEETELGRDIDCASLRAGLAALRARPTLRLAVNMSARSIADGTWREVLRAGLASDPGIGGRLILEISEASAMMLPEIVVRFMAEMQPLGVAFALDDFGSGHIAFRHLREFLFDLVKIDRIFVTGIAASPDNQVLSRALIAVARQFEMFVVAEGVECASDADEMIRLGVDCLQGWHFGRPKPLT